MDRRWKVLASEPVIQRPWLDVRRQTVLLASGHRIDEFHLIGGPDWAATLALTEDAEVVMVEQYRHGAQTMSLELPAGVIEPHETPLQAAQRELREETGFVSEDWTPLVRLCPDPTRHTSFAHFFIARKARRVTSPKPDPSEDLSVSIVQQQTLLEHVLGGRVVHAVHIAAILLARERGALSLNLDGER